MSLFSRFLRPSASLPLDADADVDGFAPRYSAASSTDTLMTDTADFLAQMNATLRRHLVVVGARGAGKTALVHALSSPPRPPARSFGMAVSTWTFEDDSDDRAATFHVSVWDFAGGSEPTARLAAALTTPQSLCIVCVDARALLDAASVVLTEEDKKKNKKKHKDDALFAFVDASILPWLPQRGTATDVALVLTKMDLVTADEGSLLQTVKIKVADRLQKQRQVAWSNYHSAPPSPLAQIRWLSVNIAEGEPASAQDVKNQMEKLVVESGESLTITPVVQRVIDVLDELRAEIDKGRKRGRASRVFIKVTKLVQTLRAKIPWLPDATARDYLRSLHDVGDLVWFHDGLTPLREVVILDPTVLVDFVRVVIEASERDRNDEIIPHAVLMGLELWYTVDDVVTAAVKQFMARATLAYASYNDVEWDSDLLVPSYWKGHAGWSTSLEGGSLVPDPSVKPTKLVQWQYHFVGPAPRDFYEKMLVASYSPLWHRTIAHNGVVFETDDDFACRVVLDQSDPTACIVHLSAVAFAKDASSWWIFQCAAQAIEKVLDGYAGVLVSRCALNDDDDPHRLETVVGYWTETSPAYRTTIAWLPPDLAWYQEIIAKRRETNTN